MTTCLAATDDDQVMNESTHEYVFVSPVSFFSLVYVMEEKVQKTPVEDKQSSFVLFFAFNECLTSDSCGGRTKGSFVRIHSWVESNSFTYTGPDSHPTHCSRAHKGCQKLPVRLTMVNNSVAFHPMRIAVTLGAVSI